MITKKMKALVEGGSAIRAMFEEGKKMIAERGAENVFDFSLGNPSIVPPKSVKESIIDIVNTPRTSARRTARSISGQIQCPHPEAA